MDFLDPQTFQFDNRAAAAFLVAVSNAKRLEVMRLVIGREWSVNSLAVEVGLSQSALSQHLTKLRVAGLVSTRREAQSIFYSCQKPQVVLFMKAMNELFPLPVH